MQITSAQVFLGRPWPRQPVGLSFRTFFSQPSLRSTWSSHPGWRVRCTFARMSSSDMSLGEHLFSHWILHTDCNQHKVKLKSLFSSPHLGSELCSSDLHKYLPWSLGLSQSIYPSGYPSQLPGEYISAHTQLGAAAYKSALTGTHLLLGREKQCSVKCLAQGHNEQTHRQGIEPGSPAVYHWTTASRIFIHSLCEPHVPLFNATR